MLKSLTSINGIGAVEQQQQCEHAMNGKCEEDEDSVLELGQIALLGASRASLKRQPSMKSTAIENMIASRRSLSIRAVDKLGNSRQLMNKIGLDVDNYKELTEAYIAEPEVKFDTVEPSAFGKVFIQVRGYIFGMLSAFMFCLSQVIIRRSKWLSGADHSLVRHLVTFIIMFTIVKYKNLRAFGPKKQFNLLVLRGNLGVFALLTLYIAIILIDPSDIISLSHTSLIMTAVMARFFLKEKLTLAHFVAIFFTAFGVVLISKPSFVFGPKESPHVQKEKIFDLCMRQLELNTSRTFNTSEFLTSCVDNAENELKSAHFKNIAGISFCIFSAFLASCTYLLLRKLNKCRIHWAVNTLSMSWFGIPLSILASYAMFKLRLAHVNFEMERRDLPMDIFYSAFASVLSSIGQVFLNISLKYEDTTKIAITKTIDVFFAFILQFLLLNILPDWLSVLGAVLIIMGTFFILLFKILEIKYDSYQTKQALKYANFYKPVNPNEPQIEKQPETNAANKLLSKKKIIKNNLLKLFFFEF